MLEGVIELQDILGYLEDLTALIDKDSMENELALIEVRDAKLRGFDFRSVRRIAELSESKADLLKGTRTAVVADGRLAFGLVRMYISIRDPRNYDFRVFKSIAEATAWLGEEIGGDVVATSRAGRAEDR